MSSGPQEPNQLPLSGRASRDRAGTADELTQVKRELLQAEVRLAKARATAAAAEVDVKVLGIRLRSLAK